MIRAMVIAVVGTCGVLAGLAGNPIAPIVSSVLVIALCAEGALSD